MAPDVLVIGATGYAGRHIATALANAGHSVRAVVRSRARAEQPGAHGAPSLAGSIAEWIERPLTEPGAADGLCDGVQRVVSALGVTRQKADPWTVDFLANLRVLEDARRSGVESFLYVNVMHVWSGRSMILRSKAAFCAALEQSSLRHHLINPSGYFSDVSEYLEMARRGLAVLPPDPDVKVQPIHGADLADFCLTKLDEPSGSWDVGGPDTLSYRDIATLAGTAVGKQPRLVVLPRTLMAAGVAVASRIGRRQRDLAEFFSDGLTQQATGEPFGSHHLADFFATLTP
ncbi:SDR family oxidoreductase [Aestuariimicrobium soli]|uniref:SDR family oxidoreductase n=1 Tax=Aestuariimicrobium soli TaxID=2035834 RepID=UPI003EB7029F